MIERSDDDCGDIGKRILMAWGEQKSLPQIAEKLGLKLKVVSEILKREQKKIVEQGGVMHGRERNG